MFLNYGTSCMSYVMSMRYFPNTFYMDTYTMIHEPFLLLISGSVSMRLPIVRPRGYVLRIIGRESHLG